MSQQSTVKKPAFGEAFRFWLKLGFISFGGPAGQIAIMHTYVVEQKKWISESRFLHALNYCMLLPGPEAQQLATYIGWLLHGVRGGLVAGILFVLPSMLILLGLSILYVSFGTIPWVYALFYGLKPAVVAIVILALIKIAKKSLLSSLHYVVAGLSFICIYFFNIPFPYLILSVLLLAWSIQRWKPALLTAKQEKLVTDAHENSYLINRDTLIESGQFRWSRFLRQLAIGLLLWILPFGIYYVLSADFIFYRQISLFFTQAALVTFGGAYAVLPYVAQVAVEKFGWLSGTQMIDGLALGETTPGPLIMVLVFVGFMAGYNQSGGSLVVASSSLLVTTYYTFLPCFLFILIGAPLVERTQHNPRIKAMLGLVTAAVVGVVLNLTVFFGQAVIFPKGIAITAIDWFALVWIVISFVALYRFKIGMIPWIGISALAGLGMYVVRLFMP